MSEKFFFMRTAVLIVMISTRVNSYYDFNPCGIFVIFSNSQPRLGTRKISGGRKFSEIFLGPKNMSSNVRNRLKCAKISWKDLLCTQM